MNKIDNENLLYSTESFLRNFIYLFMVLLGLHCCVGFFLVVVCGGVSCSSWTLEHRLDGCGTGLVALQHVGSSQTRDRTHVSCIGSWILYHRATREAPRIFFRILFSRQSD